MKIQGVFFSIAGEMAKLNDRTGFVEGTNNARNTTIISKVRLMLAESLAKALLYMNY